MTTLARWKVRPDDASADEALAAELRVSSTLAALLRHRGAADPSAARAFLDPKLTDLEAPEAMLDVDRGAERVARAIRNGERITVYGDYDVDGMTGTCLLVNFLKLAGANHDWYIPNRLKEGYSFSDEALDTLLGRAHPPKVIITVDHGISAAEPIRRLREAGVDVIVTDHHEPPPLLPDHAYALINPRRPGDPSVFKDLCGAGVAFKLAWATAQKLSKATRVSDEFRAFLLDATAFVAMATVADVVRLWRDNRILCSHGLKALKASRRPGIRALLHVARLDGQNVHAVHVGFRLGPRLNAVGRLGMAEKAIELLTTDDEVRATALAQELEEANVRRKEIEGIIQREAEEMVKRDPPTAEDAICLGSTRWHPGVIGIVASRLVDRWRLPVMLVALNGAAGRGSARAPAGVHLRNLLAECAPHLAAFGGHAGAAGGTVTEERWPAFQTAFRSAARRALTASPIESAVDIDLELPFRRIGPALMEEVDRLAPHGAGNPAPIFCTHGLRVAGRASTVGPGGAHLRCLLSDGEVSHRAVGFNLGSKLAALEAGGSRLSAAYRLKFDTFREPGAVELELIDVRPA
jgi:single-stranded-DNA-specific exonuclease